MIWTPYDIIKQQMQVRSSSSAAPQPTSVLSVAQATVAKHGVFGLWRGIAAGWITWGPFSALYFWCYEASKQRLLKASSVSSLLVTARACPNSNPIPDPKLSSTDLTFAGRLLCGVLAGAVGAAVTQPIDAVKLRMQVGQCSASHVLREMVRQEGLAPLLRGVVGRVAWLAPGAGITISVFESVFEHLTTG